MSKWTERLPPYTIYKVIDNTNQNTVYVGLTKRTLQARLQAHSDHTDSPINELIKEKGKQNFSIVAIDYAQDKIDGWEKEEFWTRFLLTIGCPLLNKDYGKTPGPITRKNFSLGQKGKHFTAGPRAKLSKANKGRFMGIEHLRSICVRCIETGAVYGSISEAGRMVGVNLSAIAAVCKGKRQRAKGYHWCYATREEYFLCHQYLG